MFLCGRWRRVRGLKRGLGELLPRLRSCGFEASPLPVPPTVWGGGERSPIDQMHPFFPDAPFPSPPTLPGVDGSVGRGLSTTPPHTPSLPHPREEPPPDPSPSAAEDLQPYLPQPHLSSSSSSVRARSTGTSGKSGRTWRPRPRHVRSRTTTTSTSAHVARSWGRKAGAWEGRGDEGVEDAKHACPRGDGDGPAQRKRTCGSSRETHTNARESKHGQERAGRNAARLGHRHA